MGRLNAAASFQTQAFPCFREGFFVMDRTRFSPYNQNGCLPIRFYAGKEGYSMKKTLALLLALSLLLLAGCGGAAGRSIPP